ncbi:ImmA/IrrE family metallo-endopeptidase [Cohnella cholangitidis]|uniref:ImmA/IrrE family metallo-endopeptidase n=1 Tax=Cohnella cholangitidis TaxID=2598458 RepID=A0A7G5C175_9BACL|nr:ImmA/IrrE family metallo-endopeptidase [Cohnella cholangitidis]QMV42959.1 ImmA/IrrE family metallo-endopeptidase [Cohnella cholangitidis]
MYRYYQTTPLEQWIEQLWLKSGITAPSQLNVEEVASRLDVWVHYMKDTSRALEYMGMRTILIDQRQGSEAQWEDFLHELCHVLRHAGNQTTMPRLFCEGQEAEANRFVLYAAMPFFMLRHFKLPRRIDEAAESLACHFGVTFELARKRLEQVQRRMFASILWEETLKQEADQRLLRINLHTKSAVH